MTENETDTEITEWPLFEEVRNRCDVNRNFPKLLKTIQERSCGIITAHRNYPTNWQRRTLTEESDWGVFQKVREIEERNVHLNVLRQERLIDHINEGYFKRIEILHLCRNIVEQTALIWNGFGGRERDQDLLEFLKDLSMKFNQKSFYYLPHQSTPVMYEWRDGQWKSESKSEISTLTDLERVLQEHKQAAYRDLPGPDLPRISACEVIELSGPIEPRPRGNQASPSMAKAMFYMRFYNEGDVMDFLSTIERERHLSTRQYENLFRLLSGFEMPLGRFARSLLSLKYRKRRDVGEDQK